MRQAGTASATQSGQHGQKRAALTQLHPQPARSGPVGSTSAAVASSGHCMAPQLHADAAAAQATPGGRDVVSLLDSDDEPEETPLATQSWPVRGRSAAGPAGQAGAHQPVAVAAQPFQMATAAATGPPALQHGGSNAAPTSTMDWHGVSADGAAIGQHYDDDPAPDPGYLSDNEAPPDILVAGTPGAALPAHSGGPPGHSSSSSTGQRFQLQQRPARRCSSVTDACAAAHAALAQGQTCALWVRTNLTCRLCGVQAKIRWRRLQLPCTNPLDLLVLGRCCIIEHHLSAASVIHSALQFEFA